MGWLQALAAEFVITATDGTVWLSIGQGLLFAAVCLLVGVWSARFVGLLDTGAPTGETVAVGLASGLLVVAACWAAFASGGRSSFVPVAVGFGIAITLAVLRRVPLATAAHATATIPLDSAAEISHRSPTRRRDVIMSVLGGATFVVAVGLLYGSTMAQSPRDGVQPLEFYDEAYYSILGADLATTGTELLASPSGLSGIEGLPDQTWYHWGELWLGAAVIRLFGAASLDARYFVVLPTLLLAAAALTGTLVRRVARVSSQSAFLFGFLACLFLAPFPQGVGTIFEITTYGLATVAVLFGMYCLVALGRRPTSWALAWFVGSAAAVILPTHILIAGLAVIGVGGVWVVWVAESLFAKRRLPAIAPVWRRVFSTTAVLVATTVAWGVFTGHGVVSTGVSATVSPFNAFWREYIATMVLGAGAFLAIAIAWFPIRKHPSIEAGLYLGTAIIVVTGTLAWGALLGSFDSLHLFSGAVAVFATPVAAAAVWTIWLRLRATGHRRVAVAALVLCGAQLAVGVALGVVRLQVFGPGDYAPVPMEILADIRDLPNDAKLAYACRPFEESTFWNPRLLGLEAHTRRRIVPMCFESDILGVLTGGRLTADAPSPLFQWAPQRTLYPDPSAHPSTASVASFLRANGIKYIYADGLHPNTLVPDAIPIASSGDTQVLRLP